MSTTNIRNKKDLTKLKEDLHGKDSDRLLNIDETAFQYVITTVMRIFRRLGQGYLQNDVPF